MSEHAERIKDVIENCEPLNQRKVAALVGVKESTMSNWMKGSRGMNADKILKICEAIKPYVGDCRFYVFTGEKPEDHLRAFDINSRYMAKNDVINSVQEFLIKMNSLKEIVVIGKLDEIMDAFATTINTEQNVINFKTKNGS